MSEQKQTRRIVSRAEYFASVAKKIATSGFGIGVLVVGLLMLRATGYVLWCFFAWQTQRVALGISVVIVGAGSIFLLWQGKQSITEAIQIDTGTPITHANTADLPAEETLVRASVAPIEQQQSTLLRATSQSDTTPAEQLVRPAGVTGQ